MNKSSFLSFKTLGWALILLGAFWGVFAWYGDSRALPDTSGGPKKIGIIRYLKIYDPEVDGFKEEMAKIGYKEGENVTYHRFDVDKVEEATAAARTLIAEDVDLIYAVTTVAASSTIKETIAAKRTDIPVVFAQGNLAVKAGLVKSFKSSGNNATGVAVDFVELTAKKLEFLKMINPNAKKLGYFDAVYSDPAAMFNLEELKAQAPKFGLMLVPYKVTNPVGPLATAEIKSILNNIKPGEIDAYFHLPGPIMGIQNQPMIQERLNQLKIVGAWLELPSLEIGGLFTYSHDLPEIGRQAANIAHKVLKGTLPTDIPVEFPRKYFLGINLKTARESGIDIPSRVLNIASIRIGE